MLPDEMKVKTKGLVDCGMQRLQELFPNYWGLGLVISGVVIALRNQQ